MVLAGKGGNGGGALVAARRLAGWGVQVHAGLDATTGLPMDPVVKADVTFTLALPKTGLSEEKARPWVGELYLGDIGVPPQVYERFGHDVEGLFSEADMLFLG